MSRKQLEHFEIPIELYLALSTNPDKYFTVRQITELINIKFDKSIARKRVKKILDTLSERKRIHKKMVIHPIANNNQMGVYSYAPITDQMATPAFIRIQFTIVQLYLKHEARTAQTPDFKRE